MKIESKGKKATKADESIGIFEKAKEPVPGLRPLGEVPPVRSGPASGSREPAPPDGEEERPEPQDVEPKLEVKEEEKAQTLAERFFSIDLLNLKQKSIATENGLIQVFFNRNDILNS